MTVHSDATALLMQFGHDVGRVFRKSPAGYCRVDDHGWLGLTGEKGTPDFNMSFVARTAPASLVEDYTNEISERGLAAVMLVDEEAEELVDAAAGHSWRLVGTVPVMVWQDGPALRASEGISVRLASPEEHEAVCRLIAEGFAQDEEMILRAVPRGTYADGVEAWVAERDGELVGTGTLVRTGGHVGVYSMTTPERNQRQGIGRALLSAAMAHHLARGAKTFTLEATPAGRHLYEQLGYRTVANPNALVAAEPIRA